MPKTADSADHVFVGHLVTNQPLTEAKGSFCHSYCAGHSRARVTLWSLWASGATALSAWLGGVGAQVQKRCSPPQGEGSREDASRGASCPPGSGIGVWRGKREEGRGLGMGTLSPQLSPRSCES